MSDFSMLDLFSMEVETQAAILNENLLELEVNPESPKELEALMRAAHSIKGAARIVQIDAAVNIAHKMEDCFVAAIDHKISINPEQIDILLQSVDFLLSISKVTESQLTTWLQQHQSIVNEQISAIAAILEGKTSFKEQKPEQKPKIIPNQIEDIIDETPEIIPNQIEDIIDETPEIIPNQIEEQREISSNIAEDSEITFQAAAELVNTNISSEIETSTLSLDTFEATTLPTAPSLSPASAIAQERVVRVSADNLNRLMGLAGESLVEANWLQPFADSLLLLKRRQMELSKILERLQDLEAKQHHQPENFEYLKVARIKEQECREILGDRLNELELYARRTTNLSDRLYREVIASHMRPFADGVQSFPRMIRDLARDLGKKVKLDITGKSTSVDRDILNKLEAPLTHILRNSVDHGIETPEERRAAGKPEQGTIRLEAFHRGGMLSISITDDGKGIDLEQLRQKIVAKKLTTPEMSSQLTEHELLEFLFLPGFSTARQVTEISGRGVGLDIAKSMAQEVGGTVRAISKLGQGMSFHFQLPLTLSVIRTLLVEIADEPYAFPLARIDQIVIVERPDISVVENRQYFTLNDEHIGLVSAHQILELPEAKKTSDSLPVVVISEQSSRFGLVVDKFLGERDLVVRPLDQRLGKIQDISAAALMGDGSPVLIVDVSDLVRSIDNLLNSSRLTQVSQEEDTSETQKTKRILVVDDSITVREMERKLLENRGYQVEVAVNGMDGWNAVRTNSYDLVISDIDMPRMNGIEFVTHIKSNPQLKSMPVIIVSYKDREEDRLQGLEAGANYYLTKSSFHDDTLINAVVDLIGS